MKKQIVTFSLLLFILLGVYVNEYLKLEYNVNILEYIKLSSDFTEEELDLIEKSQPLIYGGNINEPPLGIYYEENGQYVGLVVDYINALSIELGATIVSQPMVWNDAIKSLMEGKTDLCDMIPSSERAKYFAFSKPIYRLRGLIVTKSPNSTINDFNDLDGKTIGVQKGDYALEYMDSSDIKCNIIHTDNLSEALTLLQNNKVDAVIGDEPVIRYYLNELVYVDNYRILEEPLYDTECAFAVPREKVELLGVIDKAIFNMRKNGTLDKIQTKWAGRASGINTNRSVEKLKLSLITFALTVVILGYLVFLWNRSLKLLIDSRTREIQIMKNELEIVFDGMENFLVVIGKDLRIKNINSSFLKYLKRDKNSVLDSFLMDIPLLFDFQREYDKLIYELLNSREEHLSFDPHRKYEIKSQGRLYEISIYPLEKENSQLISILVMIADITNRRLQEQKLIHSNKMESIGQLAAGVAHELRNPLGIIRNSTFILKDEYGEEDKLKTMAINAIDNAVKRAGGIIDNLLKFSRLTHDTKEIVNLNALIADVINLYKKSLREHSISLETLCDEIHEVHTNSQSLRHILMNLIQNAIDAMPNGGELAVSCFANSDGVEIRIGDNGIGIDKNIIEKIFDPFFTTKPVGKGTGLGLYIAYSEAQKINGNIRVISEKGKGTTFIIDIPLGSDENGDRVKASAS